MGIRCRFFVLFDRMDQGIDRLRLAVHVAKNDASHEDKNDQIEENDWEEDPHLIGH